MPQDYNIRAVERALSILDCYKSGDTSYSLVEISKKIELTPSTTLRLLSTLENCHYLYRHTENGRYYLGSKIAQLGHTIYSNMDICQEAQPYLKELCRKYNESVGIYQRQGDSRICITRINSNQTLRSVITVGSTYTLTRGASGKTLLAYLPESEQARILEPDPFTTYEELNKIRQQKYAVSYGERDAAVESIASPVFEANGEVHYCLFMTGPVGRFNTHPHEELIRDIQYAALQISLQMGYRPKNEQ